MVSASRYLLIPVLLAGWLGLIAPASAAVAPVIKDDAKFFSAEAVDRANKKIKEIAQKYNKDLLIETFPEIPEDRRKDYKEEDKRQFFEKWARERAHDNAVNGVYVLICKEPPHLQVGDRHVRGHDGDAADVAEALQGLARRVRPHRHLDAGARLLMAALVAVV